jgi:hypothetical protein
MLAGVWRTLERNTGLVFHRLTRIGAEAVRIQAVMGI